MCVKHILPEQRIFEVSSTREKIIQRITDPDIINKVESLRPDATRDINQQTWGVVCEETDKRVGAVGYSWPFHKLELLLIRFE